MEQPEIASAWHWDSDGSLNSVRIELVLVSSRPFVPSKNQKEATEGTPFGGGIQ